MKMHLNSFNPFANASGITIEAIHLKPSHGFKMLALALLFIAISFGTSMPLSYPGLLALIYLALVAVMFWWNQAYSIRTVIKQSNGLFVLESPKKTLNNMELQSESLSTPIVCVLYFKPVNGGRTHGVFIWRDSVPPELFRRLRGWLQWCAQV
jgi:hypothetical protein